MHAVLPMPVDDVLSFGVVSVDTEVHSVLLILSSVFQCWKILFVTF